LIYKVTSCSVAWRHIIALEASHNNLVLDSQADETPGAKIIGVSIGGSDMTPRFKVTRAMERIFRKHETGLFDWM
jgi:hypothetical protein